MVWTKTSSQIHCNVFYVLFNLLEREKKIHAHLEDIVITDICGNPIF